MWSSLNVGDETVPGLYRSGVKWAFPFSLIVNLGPYLNKIVKIYNCPLYQNDCTPRSCLII